MIVPAPSSTPAFAWSDFGIRYRPKDRNHGEPFPLPRLSRSGRKEESSVRELKQRVDGSLKALNDLASAPFDAALCPELPLTQSQKWILDDVRRRVSYYGPQPSEMDEQSALRDLISKANLYTGEAAHLASFDMDKIQDPFAPPPTSTCAGRPSAFCQRLHPQGLRAHRENASRDGGRPRAL